MPAKGQYRLSIVDNVNVIKLYDLGVPTSTIGHIYGFSITGIWNILKRYEKINFVKLRNQSETNTITLSKRHSEPKGDNENRIQKWLRKFGIEGIIDLITVILLTDGSASYKHKIVSLYSSDETALNIFTDLLRAVNLEPRKSYDRRNNLSIIFARSNKVRNLLDKIKSTIPTTKHQPARGKQTWKDFLTLEEQPTILFLLNRPKKLRELAFRLATSFEGCVMVDVRGKKPTRVKLQFTCFHPLLIEEWKRIADSIGINMLKQKNTLITTSLNSIIKFLEIGCFINGVVNSEKSRYFVGTEKNKILLGLLEYCYRERENIITKINSPAKINNAVKNIIKEKQFKYSQFYIRYFSNISEKYHGLKTRESILNALRNGPKKLKEIINETNFKEQRVYPILRNLINEGKIKRIKFGVYSLVG